MSRRRVVELSANTLRGFGPSFQRADSRLYRLEYGVLTLAVLGYLVWRAQNLGGVDILQTVGWILFPDLVAFLPIGLSSSRKTWPRWGGYLYNTAHTHLVWGLVFVVAWIFLQTPYWPLFGWLGHITADRALGFGLRETGKS
jgi:uncharacterized protein DUF4260